MTGHMQGGGWSRADYLPVLQPGAEKRPNPVMIPALPIMVRNPAAPAPAAGIRIRADGVIDTGASVSALPLWAVWYLGIAVGKESTKPAFSASGKFTAYGTRVGMEVMHDGKWVDIGVIDALAPDTPLSRDPSANLPFLLGRKQRLFQQVQRVHRRGRQGGVDTQGGGRRLAILRRPASAPSLLRAAAYRHPGRAPAPPRVIRAPAHERGMRGQI